ncbi:hypothetical protein LCGC14_1679390 [marine sediment metagenome]|uniref:Uncharacterized protein n=1 Tax=marine sediment metagenome TaxID=412755 RepID=A0A0F9IBJ3_9ZZZZ
MLVKALAVSLAVLFLACSQTEKEIEVVRVPVEVPVVTEVVREVPVEVPVEVLVEVAPPNCPPAPEVDWLIWSLEDARAMHLAWADYLLDNPLGVGLIENAIGSRDEQLSKVAAYDRRLGIVRQLQRACAQ